MVAPQDQTVDSQSKVPPAVFALFFQLTVFSQASHNPPPPETVCGGNHYFFGCPVPFFEFPVINHILFECI